MPAPEANGERFSQVQSSDGLEIATWTAAPDGPPRGTVILCHGLTTGADDGGPFLPLRDLLLRRGFATVRFDARCHGQTGGPWEMLSIEGWADDIEAVSREVETKIGDSPLLMLAASFAGGPATEAANRLKTVTGIVYWNATLDYRSVYLDSRFGSARVALATKDSPDLPAWAVMQLPWSENVPLPARIIAEFEGDRALKELERLTCAKLALHGTHDRIVPLATTRSALENATATQFHAVPLAQHGFRFFRAYVRWVTVRWLEQRVGHRSATPTI